MHIDGLDGLLDFILVDLEACSLDSVHEFLRVYVSSVVGIHDSKLVLEVLDLLSTYGFY